MKKSTVRVTMILIILFVVLVGVYAYLSNKSRSAAQEGVMTNVQKRSEERRVGKECRL